MGSAHVLASTVMNIRKAVAVFKEKRTTMTFHEDAEYRILKADKNKEKITNDLRKRTNVHISCGKSEKSTNKADKHFYTCKTDHLDPLFKLYVLLELNDYDKLRVYEDDFHKRGFDTCNQYKASAFG